VSPEPERTVANEYFNTPTQRTASRVDSAGGDAREYTSSASRGRVGGEDSGI